MLNQDENMEINEIFNHFIETVLETQNFGVCSKGIELNWVQKSGKKKGDRFNFSIPYAGNVLEWTVMFNSNCPEMGPDFLFHDDSFLADPDVDTVEKLLPSLAKWQSLQPDSLLNVLNELVDCYKQHQIDLLSRIESRLHMEYTMLVDKADVAAKDMEIILLPDANAPKEARFVIRLAMDFSRLPGRSKKAMNDAAMIVVTFQQPNWNKVTPELFLTTSLEEAFGHAGLASFTIPPFSQEKTLMDYIPEVQKIISNKVNTIVENYEKKNSFIATLLFLQRRNVVEYDALEFSRITMLLEYKDFFFFLHFSLSFGFPSKPPVIQLQSIYHMKDCDELVSMQVKEFPYDQKWECSRMVKSILEKILSKDALTFRDLSLRFANSQG